VNVDICYVPVTHQPASKLPAVSGSSGHLVVERTSDGTAEVPAWPGQIFTDATLSYTEAMAQYAEVTRERLVMHVKPRDIQLKESGTIHRTWEIQLARHAVRERRKQEDLAWRRDKATWRATREARKTFSQAAFAAAQAAWNQRRAERQSELARRPLENAAWHASIAELRTDEVVDTPVREWIAVVVVTDNSTRQCVGLPAFTSGARLKSEEVIAELRKVLPEELAYLISDQGVHFRSNAFARFAQEAQFIQVPVYRHRPESNGIAERFVRTLKTWLRPAVWQTYSELVALLATFQNEYNDRPHQGLPIPGLSPNEFANRAWLM
jgi:transposase InsO family protein